MNSTSGQCKHSRRSASARWLGGVLLGLGALVGAVGCVTTLDDVEKYKPVEVMVVEQPPLCELGEMRTSTCTDAKGRPGEVQQVCAEGTFNRFWEGVTECTCIDETEVTDFGNECPALVPRRLRCEAGRWEELECADPCTHYQQACGPLRADTSIDCGGCEGSRVCVPDTLTCETIGDPDPATGYIWAFGASNGDHAEAVRACEQLVVGKASNFRLPTISELRTLVGDCPDLAPDGICRVTDTCSAESCQVPENCTCLTGGSKEDDGCFGGAIYDALIGNRPPFCDVLWSATPASDTDFWLISFDGTLNHREATYSAKALCIYEDT